VKKLRIFNTENQEFIKIFNEEHMISGIITYLYQPRTKDEKKDLIYLFWNRRFLFLNENLSLISYRLQSFIGRGNKNKMLISNIEKYNELCEFSNQFNRRHLKIKIIEINSVKNWWKSTKCKSRKKQLYKQFVLQKQHREITNVLKQIEKDINRYICSIKTAGSNTKLTKFHNP
jgi:hypothetical protein